MNNLEFIDKLKYIVDKKTVYMWGCFGQEVTFPLINQKSNQYQTWYNSERIKLFESLANKDVYAFDCVNLIKGILWGWNDGKVTYLGNREVPDVNADKFITLCEDVSTNFNSIEVGNAVWLKGHIGVYIGNGKVIECTPKWDNGVQEVRLNRRDWKKHGKIPYIDYVDSELSSWAVDAQAFVMNTNISDGTRPKDHVTREEQWTMLHRLYKLIKEGGYFG